MREYRDSLRVAEPSPQGETEEGGGEVGLHVG